MKRYLWYILIVVAGLGIMVGVVVWLRARNAPTGELPIGQAAPTVSGQSQQGTAQQGSRVKPLRPFVPIDQIPKAPPFPENGTYTSKESDSVPAPVPEQP